VSRKPRFVFDTSAIVSALLFNDSVPGRAFYAAMEVGEILLSQATTAELFDVLGRAKFDHYLTREEREQFLVVLLREATVVEIAEEFHASRDPRDDKFLELAVNGRASCVITGDEDLLILHPFRGIPVISPVQFLRHLAEEGESGE